MSDLMKGCARAILWAVILLVSREVFAETKLDIRGLESISDQQLTRVLGGRLYYVKSKSANAWRANDAAFLIENFLREDGFPDVEVSAEVVSGDRIRLTVREGLRLLLGEVSFVGGAEEELLKVFQAPFQVNGNFGRGDMAYKEETLAQGLDFVTRSLKAKGYWYAKTHVRRKNIDRKTGEVTIELSVNRGHRFKIGKPTVNSPDGRGVKRSATTWDSFIGQWATTENISKLRAAMVEAFTSRGYPSAKITMNRRLIGDQYIPDFRIELGVRVKLLEVKITGLQRTKEKRILQIMEPLKNGWYDEVEANERIKLMLATGAFRSIQSSTETVARKRVATTLHFEERKAKEISLGAGFATFYGPLLRAKYTDNNFRGKLRGFTAGTEISGRGILGEVRLNDPWWRGSKISRELRGYSLIRSFEGYDTYDTGASVTWRLKSSEHHRVELQMGASYALSTAKGLAPSLIGEDDYVHAWLGFDQVFDYRDSAVIPKDGWHFSTPLKIASAFGDDTNSYVKFGVDSGWYYALNHRYSLGVGGTATWLRTTEGLAQLPVDLRLFNGGARSVRSFPERELGPSSNGDPYGGEFSWAVNVELTRRVTNVLGVVAFADIGRLEGDFIAPKTAGTEVAVGLGLRLDLPIGPIRLEYGHNMTRDFGEPSGTWHFAVGATF